MTNGFDIIYHLTSSGLATFGQERMIKDFALLLGWEPSERLSPDPELREITNGHLVVEHGLEKSAVITFLVSPVSFSSLKPEQIRRTLGISYNNLIDWHIYVELDKATYVYNRKDPPEPISHRISQSNIDCLKSTLFEQITGSAPNPNFPALDNALVENISFWKRNLAAELNGAPELSDYATLFNSIIFVRAAEDHQWRSTGFETQVLLDEWSRQHEQATLRLIVQRALTQFVNGRLPRNLLDPDALSVFDGLSSSVIYDLLLSFYKSRRIPYRYDFAIMSKHALSRIYEHYISLLSFEDSPQLSFFPTIPMEKYTKTYGSIFTPQFIARFFARYVREQLPPSIFRKIETLDPACGSGIFLRTILELQCAPTYDGISSEDIQLAFSNVKGIDIDENAVQSTKLSLSLLYLVLMSGELPRELDINTSDIITYFEKHPEIRNKFDVVVVNPPFVSTEYQSAETRERIASFMSGLASGKIDTYLPFLKIGIESLKPGGFGLFVLPHSFLRLSSSANIRSFIYEHTWIRCIADLSEIPVFGERGSYVILLIFQKKPEDEISIVYKPRATLILCRDQVGNALQDYLAGRRVDKKDYSIYDVEQDEFSRSNWLILPPKQAHIQHKLSGFESLGEFLHIGQGIVTGHDEIFIVTKSEVPSREQAIWKPLLKDRDMERYTVPKSSSNYVFYPIINGEELTIDELEAKFPNTWNYINSKRDELTARKSTKESNWWKPHRLRDPETFFRPKLITPHLALLPKFALDEKGKYLVSHSPYLSAKEQGTELEILKFFLGVLNSSIGAWLISTYSDKYSRGYARLEVKTLRNLPVPNPAKVNTANLTHLLRLVDLKLYENQDDRLDEEIDKEVFALYRFTEVEAEIIGLRGYQY